MSVVLEQRLRERFAGHDHVGDIRGRGLFFALEFVEDRETKRPFDAELQVHERIKQHALNSGLGIYPTGGTVDGVVGDHALLAPPYIANVSDIDRIVDLLERAVDNTFAEIDGSRRDFVSAAAAPTVPVRQLRFPRTRCTNRRADSRRHSAIEG